LPNVAEIEYALARKETLIACDIRRSRTF